MDYVLYAIAEFPTRNLSNENFYLSSNQDQLVNLLGYKIYWGFTGVIVTVLKCHSSCARCTGPTANECITCALTGYAAVNGTCVCNIASNYYLQPNGICSTGCPTNDGWFRDDITRACVKPPIISNCTAPYRFGNSMGTSGYGSCVASCPAGYFASSLQMKCTQDCWTDSPNEYKYSYGATATC